MRCAHLASGSRPCGNDPFRGVVGGFRDAGIYKVEPSVLTVGTIVGIVSRGIQLG